MIRVWHKFRTHKIITLMQMLNSTDTPVQSKKAIIAFLYKLMAADNEENPSELAYIMHIGDRLGLEDEDLKDISFNMDSYTFKAPSEQREKVTILYYFLFLMKADGIIRPEEEEFVSHFGMKLGFKQDMISDLIEVLKQYVDTAVPPEELYAKVQAHLN